MTKRSALPTASTAKNKKKLAVKRVGFSPPKPRAPTNTDNAKPQTNTNKDTEMDEVRYFDTYITLKIEFEDDTDFHINLRKKYMEFLTILQMIDQDLILLTANPANLRDIISNPASLPSRMTGMIPYFYTNSRPAKDKSFMIWATARISHNVEWEDIVENSRYDLTEENITLMVKRIQCFKTQIPGYLQFVDNNADPTDLSSQIVMDIGDDWNWTLYNKEPFELDYQKMAHDKKHKKKDFFASTPHIECADGEQDAIMHAIRKWISSGRASLRFGQHIKIVECLTKKSSPTQVDRTIRMNGHGRRFQASIDMVELQGLLNPNGVVTINGKKGTLRSLILQQLTKDDKPMFLSITRKWKSPAWQITYIRQERGPATEFASCPAAYLANVLTKSQRTDVFKHFTPEAVTEAADSELEESTGRMITPSEKEARDEESQIASIEWLVDLSAMSNPLYEDGPVQFQDGQQFAFAEDVSINTTRTKSKSTSPTVSTPPPSSLSPFSSYSTPSRPSTISRDSSTVTSDFTQESRLMDLETNMGSLDTKLDKILSKLGLETPSTSNISVNTPNNNSDVTPPPAPAEGGE